MKPRIESLTEKKLIGRRLSMTFTDNKTSDLWRSFMPERKKIINNLNEDLISMQVYHFPLNDKLFDPETRFDKWAAVEVSGFESIPDNMESFVLSAGLYAVFLYKGLSSDNSIFYYIFTTWLPESHFLLDNRPHFEVLGEKYKNEGEDSEEEIWIPIRPK